MPGLCVRITVTYIAVLFLKVDCGERRRDLALALASSKKDNLTKQSVVMTATYPYLVQFCARRECMLACILDVSGIIWSATLVIQDGRSQPVRSSVFEFTSMVDGSSWE